MYRSRLGQKINQRIQELSKQASDYVNEVYTAPVRSKTPGKIWEDGHIGWYTQFNQKFAELIVRECAEIAYNKQYKHSAAHTRGDCAEAIKQHFGVKE